MAKTKEPKKFYSLVHDSDAAEADLYIFGDIVSWAWPEYGEQSGVTIANALKDLDVDRINVHINSYGGDVAEGLAIYNVLREHKAQIVTICDGFACSAASVVFMAGDRRVMSPASLLMVHNAWTYARGNAEQLRKAANDIETITKALIEAYKDVATISEKKIKELLDEETWILPADAMAYGFATEIDEDDDEDDEAGAQMSAFRSIMQKLTGKDQEPLTVIHAQEAQTPVDMTDDSIDKLAANISGRLLEALLEPKEPAKPKEQEKPDNGWSSFFD